MSKTTPVENKRIVLEAFDTLFNKRDYTTAERFWSPNYVQHSAHIEPGRDGLFNLIKAAPQSLRYEHGVILAEGDYVIVHGRFSNIGLPVNWIAADVVRLKDGILVEHWDVIQDEATEEQSKSKAPMFASIFLSTRSLTPPRNGNRVFKLPTSYHRDQTPDQRAPGLEVAGVNEQPGTLWP